MANDPKTLEEWEQWACDNPKEAVRAASGWEGSGQGYGDQAKIEWPDCPGFDWDNDCPDYHECDDRYETNVEYRTALTLYSEGPESLPGGYERVAVYNVISFEAWNQDTEETVGTVDIGEGSREVVYRRENFVCSECGSSSVEETSWVDVNTGEVVDGDPPIENHYWCNDCQSDEYGIQPWSIYKADQLDAAADRAKERNPDSEEAKRKYHGTH